MRTNRFVVTALVVALLASPAPAAGAAGPDIRTDLQVLVITDGTAPWRDAWTGALDREGVPYEVFDTSVADLTAAHLEAAAGHARYQGVVCVTDCVDLLSAGELAALDAFETAYGVRRVSGYVWPSSAYGLDAPFHAGVMDGKSGTLTAAGLDVFPYLAGPIDFSPVGWGYLATPLDGHPVTALVTGESESGVPSTLVGIYDRGGFEDLFVTFDGNRYQIQSLLLGHGLVNWVTGGVYLGYTRNYLTLQVDDIFLPDDRWDPVDNCTPGEDCPEGVPGTEEIRMTPADVGRAIAWQDDNGLVFDFVFNGEGSVEAIDDMGSDPLTDALLSAQDGFRWINHTYTHLDLDTADQAMIEYEIAENLEWADDVGLLPLLDASELVTGGHSGLRDPYRSPPFDGNPALAPALAATGVAWVGSDASRTPGQEVVGDALTVPRFPTNVYYNTGTELEQLDEYNWVYLRADHPSGEGNCVDSAITTCLDEPATWDEYVDSEASIMLPHLLANDPRPHYFHQSNLAEDGILYTLVDEVLARYERYFSVPLVQPAMSEAGSMIRRADRWMADRGSLSAYLLNGALVLENTGASVVDVPVTGLPGGELYGGIRSEWLTVPVADDPTVTVSGATTVTAGTTSTYTVTATDAHVVSFVLTATSCGVLGTTSNVVFDPDTGIGTFDCTFAGSGAGTVSATVADRTGGSGTATLDVTVSPPPSGGGGGTTVGGIVIGSGRFIDDDGNIHEPSIEAIAALGITIGCNPPVGDMYCPDRAVTRAEMAAFVARALDETGDDAPFLATFPDVGAGAWYRGAVERLAQLGIVRGHVDGTYRPETPITRAEMSALLDRAFTATAPIPTPAPFADVPERAWYADSLQRIYAEGITKGCGLEPLRYCPDDPVRRDEMASFLARALGLTDG